MASLASVLKSLPVYGQTEQASIQKGQGALRRAQAPNRDRKLLDLAHDAPCMLRLDVTGCGANLSVPCHSDMLAHGRGVGRKSPDPLAVPGCPACHEAFTRKNLGKNGYALAWGAAMARYLVWMWATGKVKLA